MGSGRGDVSHDSSWRGRGRSRGGLASRWCSIKTACRGCSVTDWGAGEPRRRRFRSTSRNRRPGVSDERSQAQRGLAVECRQERTDPSCSRTLLTSADAKAGIAERYHQVLPLLLAIPADKLPRINLNVLDAVVTVLGLLPKLRELRDRMVHALPEFNPEALDRLELDAAALAHADLLRRQTPESSKALQRVAAEAIRVRNLLRADAVPLAARGLIDTDALKAYDGTNGYKVLAFDLQILVQILQQDWERIEGRCAVTKAELAHATNLAVDILNLLGSPHEITAARQIRARAFKLFIEAYDEVRRAIVWLRWEHGDADGLAPSLYIKRGKARAKKEAKSGQGAASETTKDAPAAAAAEPIAPAAEPIAAAAGPVAHAAVPVAPGAVPIVAAPAPTASAAMPAASAPITMAPASMVGQQWVVGRNRQDAMTPREMDGGCGNGGPLAGTAQAP